MQSSRSAARCASKWRINSPIAQIGFIELQEASITVEGDNTVLQQQITRMLLLAYRQQMMGPKEISDETMRYITTPPADNMHDPVELLRLRNISFLESLAAELMQHKDPTNAWNMNMMRVCELGHGHSEYVAAIAMKDQLQPSDPLPFHQLWEYYVLQCVCSSFGELAR